MDAPFLGFWNDLPRPIVGLAPMDGVTDSVCRAINVRHGRPDVVFTEFTHAEGLIRAPQRLLRDLDYDEGQRPIVAQIYGHRPEDFYNATHVVCELGFDGIDINMGCPARKVVSRKCGAGMIQEPELARAVIRATRQAILDWQGGQTLSDIHLPNRLIEQVSKANEVRGTIKSKRKRIPYSVKTRIGYNSDIIESWVETLLAEQPAVISIHGRTLKQMYKGEADWDAIARAAKIIRPTGTLVLGNGDINTLGEAARRISASRVDGVLLGRGTLGNPWIFKHVEALRQALETGLLSNLEEPIISCLERFQVALEHTRLLEKQRGERAFPGIKRHLKGYLNGFRGAAILRRQAMLSRSFAELEAQLAPFADNQTNVYRAS